MKASWPCYLRRIINSSYHPFSVIPKPSVWPVREQLARFVGWQYGSERNTVKGGYRKQNKLFHYLDMQREDSKKLEKHYSLVRLKAALSEQNMEYKHFRNMLDKADILMDNIVLAQLAIYEPRTFESLVSLTRSMAIADGRPIQKPPADAPEYTVHLDSRLFGKSREPPVRFRRGASADHTVPPRKLRPEEF